MVLIGYSGHGYVAAAILQACGIKLTGYCDLEEKSINPFSLPFLGKETAEAALRQMEQHGYFIAIGDNVLRRKIYTALQAKGLLPAASAIHPSAILHSSVIISDAAMIGAGAILQPLAQIGAGVICNSGCIIEHECHIGDFAHIGPGTVLCGNVQVGANSFIGANSVVREGIKIGSNVIIGAGSVVVKPVPDHAKLAGNPARGI